MTPKKEVYRQSDGRFGKRKVTRHKIKLTEAVKEARKRENVYRQREKERKYNLNPHLEGRRIVKLDELGKNLNCCSCSQAILLKDTISEKRKGLHSILEIRCRKCNTVTKVATGKEHSSGKKFNLSDTNSKALLGTLHSGLGCTALNKLLTCLNVPSISPSLYKRYEREVGPAIEAAAKESCKRAAKEERQLVIENIEKLCKELPQEIVDELYPFMNVLRSCANEDSSPTNNLENNNNARDISAEFNNAIGKIINIIVCYDMGWSKRGNGRSYDSLNGYGAIIGFFSGKILDYGTRNRLCRRCKDDKDPSDHDCRKNWHGSAKAMEAHLGAALCNESTIFEEVGLKARGLVGDDDSCTISAVQNGNPDKVFKLSDKNHLKKNVQKDLYKLQQQHSELKKTDAVPHILTCFTFAVAQNQGQSVKLASALNCIPDHVYGQHENCGSWCQELKVHTITLTDSDLFNALKSLFMKYASNAEKFSFAASSQANESLNNIMAHKAPKMNCYSMSESADFRFASAVCTKNDGDSHVVRVNDLLQISPGKWTKAYMQKKDKFRKERAQTSKLITSKRRRKLLVKKREALRKNKENSEGVQYKSNCGMELDIAQDFNTLIRSKDSLQNLPDINLSLDDCSIVYFDLETSGLRLNADILQIAAKYKDSDFSVYINPSQPIDAEASRITGLKHIRGKLYLNGKEMPCIPLQEALIAFKEFLNLSSTPCILVAHNAHFDSRYLLRDIIRTDMILDFRNIVGVTDSVVLFRKAFPERKKVGEHLFKLGKLAEDLLVESQSSKNFHEAMYDVQILEKLTSSYISKKDLCDYAKPYKQSLFIKINMPSLLVLKPVVTDCMMKKIAGAGIDYNSLKRKHIECGAAGIRQMLTEEVASKKPRVTKCSKVLEKIYAHFDAKYPFQAKIIEGTDGVQESTDKRQEIIDEAQNSTE